MKQIAMALFAALTWAALVDADVAPFLRGPDPRFRVPPRDVAPLRIDVRHSQEHARLLIPRSVVHVLQADARSQSTAPYGYACLLGGGVILALAVLRLTARCPARVVYACGALALLAALMMAIPPGHARPNPGPVPQARKLANVHVELTDGPKLQLILTARD